jgi:hypothetical protein
MLNVSFLFLIAATWIGSYIDNNVPYFPIEISRTAASGPYGYYGLCAGTLLLCPYVQGRSDGWISWIGLVILAIIDDKMSWTLHMTGVCIMFIGIMLKTDTSKMIAFMLFGMLFMFRLVLRNVPVCLFEVDEITIGNIIAKNKEIMYTGRCNSEITLLMFKLSGVLQWVVFWGTIQLIK